MPTIGLGRHDCIVIGLQRDSNVEITLLEVDKHSKAVILAVDRPNFRWIRRTKKTSRSRRKLRFYTVIRNQTCRVAPAVAVTVTTLRKGPVKVTLQVHVPTGTAVRVQRFPAGE